MLLEVQEKGSFELLPSIACFLSWECDTVLDSENPIREKYGSFDFRVPIPIYNIPDKELSFPTLCSYQKEIPIQALKTISAYFSNMDFHSNPYRSLFLQYIQQTTFYVLKDAFEEIKKEVLSITQ